MNTSSLTPNASNRVDNKLHLNFETVTDVIATSFFVEFLGITAGCLLALWITMSKDSVLDTENEEYYNARNRDSSQSVSGTELT